MNIFEAKGKLFPYITQESTCRLCGKKIVGESVEYYKQHTERHILECPFLVQLRKILDNNFSAESLIEIANIRAEHFIIEERETEKRLEEKK